jgi:hypothetical protein
MNSKVWLNYNCSQGNNWIVVSKFDEIISHKDRKCFKVFGNQVQQSQLDETKLTLSHIYFTYMTEDILITLFETYDQRIFLVCNKMNIIEKPDDDKAETTSDQLIKKVDTILPLPELEGISSNIYQLEDVSQLKLVLSKKERKLIGIKDKDWAEGCLKRTQDAGYMNLIHTPVMLEYVKLFDKYVEQSDDTLNLTHNYSVTPEKLDNMLVHPKIKQLVMYQNFQINDFEWLKKLPNLKLLNLFYCHQIEQRHIEQIVRVVPGLEVINIHYCSRMNIRILIPILKLRNVNKLAIEDSQFWCQKGVHELFILPDEWKSISCSSIQKVAINSYNLTLDVIDYLLIACPNIDQLTVDENVLKSVTKNIENGRDKNSMMLIHSWQTPNKGLQVQKRPTFKNMMKDNYTTELFSESMLKKIKEHKEKNGEKEQTNFL